MKKLIRPVMRVTLNLDIMPDFHYISKGSKLRRVRSLLLNEYRLRGGTTVGYGVNTTSRK